MILRFDLIRVVNLTEKSMIVGVFVINFVCMSNELIVSFLNYI